MKKIKEDFLYYIWKTKQFGQNNLFSIDGRKIKVKNFGMQNHNSGPDFSDGIVVIDGTVWAGNIEMHIHSSDWRLHGHQKDDAYRNTILHVVLEHDKDIQFFDDSDIAIPTLELKSYINENVLQKYSLLLSSDNWIPCERVLNEQHLDSFQLWKYSLITQRLWDKTDVFAAMLTHNQNDWDQLVFTAIARYFGATANMDAFEQLTRTISIKTVWKECHEPKHIEALLFGQAGMLSSSCLDLFQEELKVIYDHLVLKYDLTALDARIWKFGKMLPYGLPTFRLAQLAKLFSNNKISLGKVVEINTLEAGKEFFKVGQHDYWEEHFIFNKPSTHHSFELADGFVNRLIINVVLPLKFLYGKQTGQEQLVDQAVDIYSEMPSELNSITKKYMKLGFPNNCALDSQALLHLKKKYCDQQQCMSCAIGHQVVRS